MATYTTISRSLNRRGGLSGGERYNSMGRDGMGTKLCGY